jgi:hypothetical protein
MSESTTRALLKAIRDRAFSPQVIAAAIIANPELQQLLAQV